MSLFCAFVFAVISGICAYHVPKCDELYVMPKVYQEKKNAPSTNRSDIFTFATADNNILSGSNDFIQIYPLMDRSQNGQIVTYTAELQKSIELSQAGDVLSPQADLAFGFSATAFDVDYSLTFFTELDTFNLGGTLNANSVNTGRLDMSNFYFEFYSFFLVNVEIDGRFLNLPNALFDNFYVVMNINSNSVSSFNYYFNDNGSVSILCTHDNLMQDFIYLLGSKYVGLTGQDILSTLFESQVSCAFRFVWGEEDYYSYDLGYSNGYLNGQTNGYQTGYLEGFEKAENQYNNGAFSNMFFTLIDTPFKVISDVFDIDFFGINLGNFIVALFSMALIYFAWKWVK